MRGTFLSVFKARLYVNGAETWARYRTEDWSKRTGTVIAWLIPGLTVCSLRSRWLELSGVRGRLTFLRFSLFLQRFSECSWSYKTPTGSVSSVSGLNKTTRSGFLAPTDSRRSESADRWRGFYPNTAPWRTVGEGADVRGGRRKSNMFVLFQHTTGTTTTTTKKIRVY